MATETRHDRAAYQKLIDAGYVWTSTSRCRDCGRIILWFRVMNDKHAPYDPGTFAIHFATCPKRRGRAFELTADDLEFLRALHIDPGKRATQIEDPWAWAWTRQGELYGD